MKEKMQKKSGRWWFWRKRADSTVKQVSLREESAFEADRVLPYTSECFSFLLSQSETKHETKEESQLEGEGATISQDKLSVQ